MAHGHLPNLYGLRMLYCTADFVDITQPSLVDQQRLDLKGAEQQARELGAYLNSDLMKSDQLSTSPVELEVSWRLLGGWSLEFWNHCTWQGGALYICAVLSQLYTMAPENN